MRKGVRRAVKREERGKEWRGKRTSYQTIHRISSLFPVTSFSMFKDPPVPRPTLLPHTTWPMVELVDVVPGAKEGLALPVAPRGPHARVAGGG